VSKRISVFLIAHFSAHTYLYLDGILFCVPLFWVHCGYFQYKNFCGEFCGANILIVEAGDSNKAYILNELNKNDLSFIPRGNFCLQKERKNTFINSFLICNVFIFNAFTLFICLFIIYMSVHYVVIDIKD
jgi:hypothetical protein